MSNSIGWGQGAVNNSIDWGQGSDNTTNGWGSIYADSWSPETALEVGAVAPVNTVAPAITGTAEVGQTLTCSQGTWTGTAPITYAYQWKRNGSNIGGATNSTYVLVTADAGTTVSCTVTATNAGGSASANATGVAVAQFLVQQFSPLVAFSLRKISSTATNAIRVRRSSDNAEQDIGFVGVDLDTASLASFVGANSAFIVKMYNQGTGGGSQDATTVGASVQPRIVNAGTLDTLNGKPAIKFDGTGDYLITNTSIGATKVNWDLYQVFSQPSASAIINVYGGNFTLCGVNGDGSASSNLGSDAPDFYYKNGASATLTTRDQVHDNIFTGGQLLVTSMGLNQDSGGNFGGYGGFHISGYTQELIYFRNVDTTSDRTSIETNINSYYAIY